MGSRSSSDRGDLSRSPSSSNAGRASPPPRVARAGILVVIIASLLSACGRMAVRASEKEYLADQTMVFDRDPQTSAADDHVLSNREGAGGGNGATGGGCGCN